MILQGAFMSAASGKPEVVFVVILSARAIDKKL